jgi:hypothetical protein
MSNSTLHLVTVFTTPKEICRWKLLYGDIFASVAVCSSRIIYDNSRSEGPDRAYLRGRWIIVGESTVGGTMMDVAVRQRISKYGDIPD